LRYERNELSGMFATTALPGTYLKNGTQPWLDDLIVLLSTSENCGHRNLDDPGRPRNCASDP
jgi:hypothetical protein